MSAIKSKVVALELELNNLRQMFTDEDRRVKNVLEQLALAQGMLASEGDAALRQPNLERLETNTAYQEILQASLRQEAAAEAFQAQREELEHNVELTSSRLKEMNRMGYEYERLKAVRDAKKASYELFLSLVEQSQAAGAMDQAGLTNVQIVDHAQVPKQPIKSNLFLTLAMGLIGAIVVGIGGAFGIETVQTTVHTRRDGELRLGIQVLGVIPERV
jgi:uncharacterized protein involved in exopolysaccharide biosynthesis